MYQRGNLAAGFFEHSDGVQVVLIGAPACEYRLSLTRIQFVEKSQGVCDFFAFEFLLAQSTHAEKYKDRREIWFRDVRSLARYRKALAARFEQDPSYQRGPELGETRKCLDELPNLSTPQQARKAIYVARALGGPATTATSILRAYRFSYLVLAS